MISEFIYIDDAYWMVVKDRYLNVLGEEYTGFPTTIRGTKKEAVKAFIEQCRADKSGYWEGITWRKARKAGCHVVYVHVKADIVRK